MITGETILNFIADLKQGQSAEETEAMLLEAIAKDSAADWGGLDNEAKSNLLACAHQSLGGASSVALFVAHIHQMAGFIWEQSADAPPEPEA